jgi:metal-responsive CopG/Arc/MetJ family transcriptional regulator
MKHLDFDPLEMLHELQKQTLQNAQNMAKMAEAFNERSQAISELTKALNHQHLQLQDLHARLQLLEMARQHEKN